MIFQWPPYFPCTKNLIPLSNEHIKAIHNAVNILKEHANLPHKFYSNISNIDFFYDTTLPFAVLGYATFFKPNRIILSKLISDGLLWTDIFHKPNNEVAMNTVIHELTHLQQMRDWKWYGWILVNNIFVKDYTIEKWANENGKAAQDFLSNYYHAQNV